MAQDVTTEVEESVRLDEELNIDHEFRPEQPIDHGGHKARASHKTARQNHRADCCHGCRRRGGRPVSLLCRLGIHDDTQIEGYVNPVSSRIAGYVTHVYVDDNQFVKAGTLLAQIDP